jgi:hypothetical protein
MVVKVFPSYLTKFLGSEMAEHRMLHTIRAIFIRFKQVE